MFTVCSPGFVTLAQCCRGCFTGPQPHGAPRAGLPRGGVLGSQAGLRVHACALMCKCRVSAGTAMLLVGASLGLAGLNRFRLVTVTG